MRSAAELKDLFGLVEVRRIEVQIPKSKFFKALMSFSAFSRHARQEISQIPSQDSGQALPLRSG